MNKGKDMFSFLRLTDMYACMDLKYVPIFLGHFASFLHNFRNIRLLDKILPGICSFAYENYFQTYPTAKK